MEKNFPAQEISIRFKSIYVRLATAGFPRKRKMKFGLEIFPHAMLRVFYEPVTTNFKQTFEALKDHSIIFSKI